MVNKQHILDVAHVVANGYGDAVFDMDYVIDDGSEHEKHADDEDQISDHPCKSTFCMAGASCLLAGNYPSFDALLDASVHFSVEKFCRQAAANMNITLGQASVLFYATGLGTDRESAVAVLRNLAETGEVVLPAGCEVVENDLLFDAVAA